MENFTLVEMLIENGANVNLGYVSFDGYHSISPLKHALEIKSDESEVIDNIEYLYSIGMVSPAEYESYLKKEKEKEKGSEKQEINKIIEFLIAKGAK